MKTKIKIGFPFFNFVVLALTPNYSLIISELLSECDELQNEKGFSKRESFEIIKFLRQEEMKEKVKTVDSIPVFKDRMHTRLSINYLEEELRILSNMLDSGFFDD